MTANALLSIVNLHKSFGGVAATKQVSLDIVKGEIHAIIGPNGAGKTTLVSQLAGVLLPDSGRILFQETISLECLPTGVLIWGSHGLSKSPALSLT